MHTPRTNLSYLSRYWEAYQREKDHFVEAIRSGTEVSVTGQMVLAVTKVCQACSESAATGQPVPLEWTQQEVPPEYTMKSLK